MRSYDNSELCGECGQPLSVWQDLEAEVARYREALTQIAKREPSSGPDYTPNIIARDALASREENADG